MTKVVNLTSEIINIVAPDGGVHASIAPSGKLATIIKPDEDIYLCTTMDEAGGTIDITSKRYLVDGLPEQEFGVIYIVTEEVAHTVRDRHDVFVPNEPLWVDGRLIGYRSIGMY